MHAAGPLLLLCQLLTSCAAAAAGQATFSVRTTSAGVASYTAKTPTASVGLDIDYATVRP